jgi:hypothetical protein
MNKTANNTKNINVHKNAIKRRSLLYRLRSRGGLNSSRFGVGGMGISIDIN